MGPRGRKTRVERQRGGQQGGSLGQMRRERAPSSLNPRSLRLLFSLLSSSFSLSLSSTFRSEPGLSFSFGRTHGPACAARLYPAQAEHDSQQTYTYVYNTYARTHASIYSSTRIRALRFILTSSSRYRAGRAAAVPYRARDTMSRRGSNYTPNEGSRERDRLLV